jgi:hypothetical protein
MMETIKAGSTDIHAGAFPHRFKALQYLYALGRIVGVHGSILVILNKKVKAK